MALVFQPLLDAKLPDPTGQGLQSCRHCKTNLVFSRSEETGLLPSGLVTIVENGKYLERIRQRFVELRGNDVLLPCLLVCELWKEQGIIYWARRVALRRPICVIIGYEDRLGKGPS